MESFSILHWAILAIVLVILGSPMLGLIRSVQNSSIPNALLSVCFPAYGLVYFFMGKRQTTNAERTRTR
jgi:hypothetical protein